MCPCSFSCCRNKTTLHCLSLFVLRSFSLEKYRAISLVVQLLLPCNAVSLAISLVPRSIHNPAKAISSRKKFALSIDSSLESWTIEYESLFNFQVFVAYDGTNSRIYQNKFPRQKFCQGRGHCINRSTIFKDLDSIAIFNYISPFLPTRDT